MTRTTAFAPAQVLSAGRRTGPRRALASLGWLVTLAVAGAGCGSAAPFDENAPHLRMDFEAPPTDFYAAPFPGAHRFTNGFPDMTGFPNPRDNDFVRAMLDVIDTDYYRGAGVSSAVYFESTALIDAATLPSVEQSRTAASSVFLAPVSSDGVLGPYHPIAVEAVDSAANMQTFGAPYMVGILPYQGAPLAADTLYVAVVLDSVVTATDEPLGRPTALRDVLAGRAPRGLDAAHAADYLTAAAALRDAEVPLARIVGMTAFRTGDPTYELVAAREEVLADPLPVLSSFTPREVFDTYCVYEASVDMPVFQGGEPPYRPTGGGWVHGSFGELVLDHTETARVFVTIPRVAAGTDGYPTSIFVRTGGGGDRPLVDRGVRDADGMVLVPGTGPAQEFAAVGVAGISIDGPHGGLRNVTGGDEQLLIFNITNPPAMRDNIRQSALELVILANLVGDISIDTSACPGASQPATLDAGRLALMGHSMGATIGPLAAAIEPRIRALLLSGAGGSWIENILYKQQPLPVLPIARLIVGYTRATAQITAHDPVLGLLLQWAGEPADPQVYAQRVVDQPLASDAPRHVLMMQGIVDTYILPSIANGLSMPLGLDLAGPALESTDPRSAVFTSIEDALPLVDRTSIAYPASANRTVGSATVTAVVTQHPEDGIEDGHEVMFQTAGPKHQYRCFLEDFAAGRTPVVPAPDAASCD
jgi:hypothetical protein